MSHVTTIRIEYTDKKALEEALKKLSRKYEIKYGNHRMYSQVLTGYGVYLPKLHFPLVIKTEKEVSINYDLYLSERGAKEEMEQFLQELAEEYAYAVALKVAKKMKGKVRRVKKKNKTVIEIDVPDSYVKQIS